MINTQHVESMLRARYADLEDVGNGVFRGIDRFGKRDYAIRYFDLSDHLPEDPASLKRYQEEVLSPMYFSSQVATDLRWSHYLYFITSAEEAARTEFRRLKAKIEADREYARKQVVRESDVTELLAKPILTAPTGALPVDLATTWLQALEKEGLGFILDDDISVPEAARRIAAGSKQKVARPVSPTELLPSERAAASRFLERLTINGFRPHPEQKDHPLGRVNLIVGSNGVGKTSLLEAIEFAYCGRNRRSSVLLDPTSITLDLANTADKLVSTSDSTRLRARHSNWYAKTDLKKISIHESFGKFNFLDTDAAVNLSVSSSSDQIGADVNRLVLGATAENLADRLRRVMEKVRDDLKGLRSDNESNRKLQAAASARADAIKSSPKHSDSLFLELLTALGRLTWLQLPGDKHETPTLREALQEAISATELLRSSSVDVLHSNSESSLRLLANLSEEASRASSLNERAKTAKAAATKSQRIIQASAERIATVDSLLMYARTGFAQLSKQAREANQRFLARKARLASFTIDAQMSFTENLLEVTVETAASSLQVRAKELMSKLTSARETLQDLESTQSNLAVLMQRLHATARDVLQRVKNPDHCPVCHTDFASGELLRRMTSELQSNDAAQAAEIQTEIGRTEEALHATNSAQSALEIIRTFLDDRSQTTSVRNALDEINNELGLLERDRTSLATAQISIQKLEADNLSEEDLAHKLLDAGMTELPSMDGLQLEQASLREELLSSQEASREATREIAEIQVDFDAMVQRLSVEPVESTDALAKILLKQVSEVEAALGAQQTLKSMMTISETMTGQGILLDLSATQDLVSRLTTSLAQESSNDIALNNEIKIAAEFADKIEKEGAKIQRLVDAETALDTLTQQSSGPELTNQILVENAQAIANTFASIHMPNEFELKVDDGELAVIRRSTGSKVELDQMSTGQRAAFALSLFLAMNGRLRSGPPILIFDDPVAHVDDINVLSFLDHLRHLAISGSRQIFFATADTKLAGLFRHKFRFLGEEFKELPLSRT